MGIPPSGVPRYFLISEPTDLNRGAASWPHDHDLLAIIHGCLQVLSNKGNTFR